MKIKVGLVDDHQLFLKSLSLMLETLQDFEVIVEALNGMDLQHKLAVMEVLPDIILLDVNMPVMDGHATATWLQENYPSIKLIALSMNEKDGAIIQMFKAGCCAYLLKDVHPAVLEKALQEVNTKGYYNSDQVNPRRLLAPKEQKTMLTAKEQQFLTLACSDRTYKQIAAEMFVSERTVDGYREALFQKLGVQSRVGMCLEALRQELVQL